MEETAGFIHKNRGRKPASSFSSDGKAKVIGLYCTKYLGANLSPKARRKTVNRLNAKLRKRKKASTFNKETVALEQKLELLNRRDAHPRHPRCAYTGDLFSSMLPLTLVR